jgi:4-amino-4-deoxy-L-arabinose transferase-like glycosyltransferase
VELATNFTNLFATRFTAWPEMLAWPYLILQGWLPYKDIAIAHNPLMLLELSMFYKLFGVGILQLKIYTWLLILLNAGLLCFVVNNLKEDRDKKTKLYKNSGIISAILYILLVIVFEGNGLWFDLALTPYAILLYYLLTKKEYLFSGVVFVLGFLTKQTFIYLALPIFIFLIQNKKELAIKNASNHQKVPKEHQNHQIALIYQILKIYLLLTMKEDLKRRG